MQHAIQHTFFFPPSVIRAITFVAIAYLLVPNILFLLGWVVPIVSVPMSLLLAVACFFVWRKSPVPHVGCTKQDLVKLGIALGSVFLFMELISFHGHLPQAGDFFVRNPIYSTLVREDWPIFSERGEYFVYYLAFWLPPALLAKSHHLLSPETWLYLWTFLGICTALLITFMRFKGKVLTFWIIFVMVGSLAHWATILPPCRVEWHTQNGSLQGMWSVFYAIQSWMSTIIYPCGGAQLIGTFNHGVPFFLFFCLLVSKLLKWNHIALISAIMVMFSPMAAAAALPLLALMVLPHLLKNGGWSVQLKTCSLYIGIALVGIVAMYFTTSAIAGESPFYFSRMASREHAFIYALSTYIFNLACIIIPTLFIIKRLLIKTNYGITVLILSIILPLIFIGSANNEFLFKGSLILYCSLAMLYTVKWTHIPSKGTKKKLIILAALSSASIWIHLGYALPNLAFSQDGIARNIRNEWEGHLNHPEAWNYRDFWAQNKPLPIFIIPANANTCQQTDAD